MTPPPARPPALQTLAFRRRAAGGDIGKEEFTALCRLIKFPFTEDSELDSILDAFDLSGDQNVRSR